MDVEAIIPIVAMLTVFGMPVAIVYVVKLFKLREKELALDAGLDQEERTKRLEDRIERLEIVITSLDREVRRVTALPAGEAPPRQLPPHVDPARGDS